MGGQSGGKVLIYGGEERLIGNEIPARKCNERECCNMQYNVHSLSSVPQ